MDIGFKVPQVVNATRGDLNRPKKSLNCHSNPKNCNNWACASLRVPSKRSATQTGLQQLLSYYAEFVSGSLPCLGVDSLRTLGLCVSLGRKRQRQNLDPVCQNESSDLHKRSGFRAASSHCVCHAVKFGTTSKGGASFQRKLSKPILLVCRVVGGSVGISHDDHGGM